MYPASMPFLKYLIIITLRLTSLETVAKKDESLAKVDYQRRS